MFTVNQQQFIRQWITRDDPDQSYDVRHQLPRLSKMQASGTCEWLTTHPEVSKWKDSNQSGIIWLHGKISFSWRYQLDVSFDFIRSVSF